MLREKCEPVSDASQLDGILDEMAAMMTAQNGVGLAAPQVGITKRFIVMKEVKNLRDPGVVHKMLNPRIVAMSDKTCVLEEGCLSVLGPDDLPIYADVRRPESVVVNWTDEHGQEHEREFTGFSARIAQHEIDHLDGILFIDHLSPVKREMLIRKVRKRKS